MMVVKNRSTPKDAAFWNHVEAVSTQSRESRQQMGEQEAVPEIPEELANLHSAATDDSMWGGRRIRTLIEQIAQDRDWYLHQIKIVNDANAALTAELAELRATDHTLQTEHTADAEAERAKYEALERENADLKQQVADGDLAFNHANEVVGDLQAQVARLSAPVSDEDPDACEGCDKPLREDEGHETEDMVMLCDECWQELLDDLGWHSEECPCDTCIASRTTKGPK